MQRAGSIGFALALPLAVAAPFAFQADRTTPIVTCGQDLTLASPIALSRENIILAGDGRLYSPCAMDGAHPSNHIEVRQRAVIDAAVRAANAEWRRLAAQALGRIGQPADIAGAGGSAAGPLATLLADPDARVRREAANAIGDAASGQVSDLMRASTPAALAEGVTAARRVLETRLAAERDAIVAAAILETLGRLHYADDPTRAAIEATLVTYATPDRDARARLGAMRGIEALVRLAPRRAIAETTRARLRQLVQSGPKAGPAAGPGRAAALADDAAEGDDAPAVAARVRRLALLALQAARDDDTTTLLAAAADGDWQVRRLAALRMDWERADFQPAVASLLNDPAFQVRYEMLAVLARHVTRTAICGPLVDRLSDVDPTVILRAIDLVPAACADKAAAIARVTVLAAPLRQTPPVIAWQVPARALSALARISPETVAPFVASAVSHPIWQVRATAATAAGVAGDAATATTLAADQDANVRNAALEALARMKSPALVPAAIAALGSDDDQLIRTAARLLKGPPDDRRAEIVAALSAAFARLTTVAADTSRDPRAAIVERLAELAPSQPAASLSFARYPVQPTIAFLAALPSRASIVMTDGTRIELALLGADAPAAVARFAELARAGHYDGLTFHRIVPNFVVQGGSPGANEYVGVARYLRDETGLAANVRGAVGLSTRGHDSGDGQIFVDLVDVPRLDHDYTVFATVTSGLTVVDRLLEGATMRSVTVR